MRRRDPHLLVALAFVCAMDAQTIPTQPSKPMRLATTPPRTEGPQPNTELTPGRTYSLPELIDFAETHNPETRVSWERAKQSADRLGIARAALYPAIAVAALAQQSRDRILFGNVFIREDLTALEPALTVYYTILDFGARRADIQISQAGVLAADLSFNDTHRQIIYAVTAAFYRLNSALSEAEAAQATLTNAETVQSAVEARLNNGLATLPDALEARAATAQAAYELETVRGLQRLAHGQLTEALGIRPTVTLDVRNLTGVETPPLSEPVDAFINRALAQRPDLLAQATQVQAADAAIRSARSQYFPKVTFSANAGEQYLLGVQPPDPWLSITGETWQGKLSATWTLFDGHARYNELDRARSEKRQAESEVSALADRIANEVWAAYSSVQTSLHRQESARVLLTASEQSYTAVLEAYRFGVKNFLDVVSAQRTLAQARTAQVQSQAEVLTNFAQLAFAAGDLIPSSSSGAPARKP